MWNTIKAAIKMYFEPLRRTGKLPFDDGFRIGLRIYSKRLSLVLLLAVLFMLAFVIVTWPAFKTFLTSP